MARNLSSPKPATPPGHSRICDRDVEVRPVSDLDVRTQNPRTHSIKQIRQIIESAMTFGWTNPMLIDEKPCRCGSRPARSRKDARHGSCSHDQAHQYDQQFTEISE